MKKNNEKKVNIRKYVNYFLCMVLIVLVCFIGIKVYNNHENSKLKESVLSKIVGNIQIDDVKNASNEFVSDDFIFVSYLNSKEVNTLEVSLKKAIIKHNLQHNFYYLDATDLMLNEGYIDTLNEKLNLKKGNEITKLPALIYYKNGKVIKTISSQEKELLKVDDFNELLDNYEIIESE